jgi:hypothetical protein
MTPGVYCYERQSVGVWSQEIKVAADDATTTRLGTSVGLSEDVVCAGSDAAESAVVADLGALNYEAL